MRRSTTVEALVSTSDRFTQFLRNLTLTSNQVTDARTKYDGVARKLHGHYFTTAFTGATRARRPARGGVVETPRAALLRPRSAGPLRQLRSGLASRSVAG